MYPAVLTYPVIFVLLSCLLACESTKPPSGNRDAFVASNSTMDSGLTDQSVNEQDESVVDASERDSVAERDMETMAGDSGEDVADVQPDITVPESDELSVRSCEHRIAYWAPAGTGNVWLAGNFTCNPAGACWGDGALPLTLDPDSQKGDNPACAEGGLCLYTLALSPETHGLTPGTEYAYKLIVGASVGRGQWLIDPEATRHTLDGECLNGAFEMPPCDSGPAIVIDGFETNGALGSASLSASVQVALDRSPIEEVSIQLNGVEIPDVAMTATGELAIAIDELAEGKHRLTLSARDAAGRVSETQHLPFWIESDEFNWLSTPLYMLLIDRFANGLEDNDAPLPNIGPSVNWQGGDLQGATAAIEAGYFDRLGIKAIWLSPANAQVDRAMPGRASPRLIAPYHGYWPIEGRRVESRFGGNEALREFVSAAHARGIRVLVDLINNQVHEEHAYVQTNPEWFRRSCVCGIDAGCGWSERPLECLFAPYLPDINWRSEGARRQFIDDALFWIEEFDVDGFRVDAVKHVETMAIYNLREALANRFEQGGHRIVMLGETAVSAQDQYAGLCGVQFDNGYEWIDAYTGQNALDGQFDFPSHHRWGGFIERYSSMRDVEAALTAAEAEYINNVINVQFLGSHDSGRVLSRVRRDPAVGCRYDDECEFPLAAGTNDPAIYRHLRLVWGLLYTTQGMPLLYYGDEIAMAGGNDPDNRRMMPWQNNVIAEFDASLSSQQIDHLEFMQRLGRIRLERKAFHGRTRMPLVVRDNHLAFLRAHEDDWAIVVAQQNDGEAVDIPRPNWVDVDAELTAVLGDATVQRTAQGWTVQSGTSGFTILVPQ